ncbi:ABC transporter permease [Enterovibrio sp. ZSDZ35]|uniref:Transport permease protein n=1 Tax=Enterovibrio qingdaonensis TaxID=2899818 RepID=A0ABT5QGR0_9GAMM|nr:ABC transporter permease [Enterovibrio sp. ZSDZ35]MDD1780159.1 ABC transporter permease [Enterovibrio sp. ZSDZ35]
MRLARILAVIAKELRQLSRDRMTFGMVVMIPIVQLMLFGYAINTDVRHIPAGLVDHDRSSYSQEFIAEIAATQVVDFVEIYATPQEAEHAITRGEIKAVLYLPSDFTQRLWRHPKFQPDAPNETARPVGQWLVDGSDTMIAASILSLRSMPLSGLANLPPNEPPPSLEVVNYFNPEQRVTVNIVPGLLAVILTMTMVLFTSAAIVREREHGNMEFLINTPIKPLELMIGKVSPYILVGLFQTAIILTAGNVVFDVPIRGGLDTLLTASLLFISASLTLGLMISTVAKTQLQAMQMTVFILLPSILLSGFMFPYDAMPEPAQWIAEALPATHFMRLVRGIVLRDAEISDLLPDVIWLAVFTVVGLIVAALRFRKKLD